MPPLSPLGLAAATAAAHESTNIKWSTASDGNLAKATLFACVYSTVCFVAWTLYWYYHADNLNRLMSNDALTTALGVEVGSQAFRLDIVVSKLAALAFVLACYLQNEKKSYCVRNNVPAMPVYCSEFVNMLGLSAYVLLGLDVLPAYLSPWKRVVHITRIGDWICSTPLLIAMVIAYDIRSRLDWHRLVFYVAVLQLSAIAAFLASIASDTQTAWVWTSIAVACFLFIFILMYEALVRFRESSRLYRTIDKSDPSYLAATLVQTGIEKVLHTTVLLTAFFTVTALVSALSAFQLISHKAEYMLYTIADIVVKIVFAYLLSSEHISLILEESLMETWADIKMLHLSQAAAPSVLGQQGTSIRA